MKRRESNMREVLKMARAFGAANENMTSSSGPDEATKRAAYYQARAAEARAKAEAMSDCEARQTMLQSAGIWDYMAEIAKPHFRSRI
jgi:hypothetical protein